MTLFDKLALEVLDFFEARDLLDPFEYLECSESAYELDDEESSLSSSSVIAISSSSSLVSLFA